MPKREINKLCQFYLPGRYSFVHILNKENWNKCVRFLYLEVFLLFPNCGTLKISWSCRHVMKKLQRKENVVLDCVTTIVHQLMKKDEDLSIMCCESCSLVFPGFLGTTVITRTYFCAVTKSSMIIRCDVPAGCTFVFGAL